jgi:hypothetical protein
VINIIMCVRDLGCYNDTVKIQFIDNLGKKLLQIYWSYNEVKFLISYYKSKKFQCFVLFLCETILDTAVI